MKIRTIQHATRASHSLITVGQHLSVCTGLVDLGTQASNFAGYQTIAPKLMAFFDVVDQVHPQSGKPLGIAKMYSASMHAKSRLRKDVESWFGEFSSRDEADMFELRRMLGQHCHLTIEHTDNAVAPRAVIAAILPVPDDIKLPAAANEPLYFMLDRPDMEAFARLPQKVKTMIEASPEWQDIAAAA